MEITYKGKGKSGRSRLITCVKVLAEIVFLLALYDKNEKKNISDNEINKLLKVVGLL